VMRVLPRIHEDVNEEWLADKSRHACDGLAYQRLDRPYVRRNGKLAAVTWDEAFEAVAAKLRGSAGNRIAAIAGDLMDAESMMALKDLMTALGSANTDCRQDGAAVDPKARASYLFNSTIAGIEQADAILIVGSDVRREAPVLNARIRKRSLRGGLAVAVIGADTQLTYKTENLGASADILAKIADGSHPFAEKLKNAKKPMIIVGMAALARADGGAILASARKVADSCGLVKDGWNGFNVLHTAAARVGGLDVGFAPGEGGKDTRGILDAAGKGELDVVFLLGADEIDTAKLGRAFVIYQGHHGDRGAHRADVILPGAAYTEKDGTYVNTEGRVQEAYRAVFPPGDAREDWTIFRALSAVLGKTLPYDNLKQLRARMVKANPVFANADKITAAPWTNFGTAGAVAATPFDYPVKNYYMTDPISRASRTMAQCTEEFVLGTKQKTGTHG
jgi:NADH-quinone oxidoreductase subunit G